MKHPGTLEPQTDMTRWYAAERPRHFFEERRAGNIGMFEFRQPTTHIVKPPSDSLLLQVILDGGSAFQLDFGAGRIQGRGRLRGGLVLPTARSETLYDITGESHGLAFDLPLPLVARLTDDAGWPQGGDFGGLHAKVWRDNAIRDLCLTLWRAASQDPQAPQIDSDAAVLQVIRLMMNHVNRIDLAAERDSRLSPRIRDLVMDYIEHNLDGNLELFTLAGVAGLSPFHFARAFRHDMGDTPHRYVTSRRLARARRMVTETPLQLAEIAAVTGFVSQQHMTTAFAQHLGTTPGRLRKAYRTIPRGPLDIGEPALPD